MIEYGDWWIGGLRAWKLSPITSTDHFEKTLSEDCEATALCSKKKTSTNDYTRLFSLLIWSLFVIYLLPPVGWPLAALSGEVWSISATSNNDVSLSI